MDEVFAKYNKFVSERKLRGKESKRESHNDSLLDFAGAHARPEGDKPKNESNAVIDELGDIFSHNSSTNNIVEPLKPVNLMPTGRVLMKFFKAIYMRDCNINLCLYNNNNYVYIFYKKR